MPSASLPVNGLLNLKMNPPKWCGSDFQTGRYNCALKPRDLWALKEEKKNETDLLSCVVAVPAPGTAGDPGLPRKGRGQLVSVPQVVSSHS